MNAKEEFLYHTGQRPVLCVRMANGQQNCILKVGYTVDQYDSFLNSIDFNYDNGYGAQEMYGIIWYTDGSWSERGEFYGSEWWEYKLCPSISPELLDNE